MEKERTANAVHAAKLARRSMCMEGKRAPPSMHCCGAQALRLCPVSLDQVVVILNAMPYLVPAHVSALGASRGMTSTRMHTSGYTLPPTLHAKPYLVPARVSTSGESRGMTSTRPSAPPTRSGPPPGASTSAVAADSGPPGLGAGLRPAALRRGGAGPVRRSSRVGRLTWQPVRTCGSGPHVMVAGNHKYPCLAWESSRLTSGGLLGHAQTLTLCWSAGRQTWCN